jgi:protein TonB
MRGRFQSRDAWPVLTLAALSIGIADAALAQSKPAPKPGTTPPPPVLILPAPPQRNVAPPVIVPGPPPAPRDPNLPTVIVNPSWARQPTVDYPTVAIANAVSAGRVVLRCTANPNGSLSNCIVIEEDPEGQGFAQAAISGARRARLSPRTIDGAAVGATVQFTIHFRAPDLLIQPSPGAPSSGLIRTDTAPVPAPSGG